MDKLNSSWNYGIFIEDPDSEEASRKLSEFSGIEITNDISDLDFALCYRKGKLELFMPKNKKLGPLQVDYLSGSLHYRIRKGGAGQELVVKAMGPKNKYPTVLDATAGLGRESFLLASQGFQVKACEQSPIIFSLIDDALKRWKQDSGISEDKLRLEFIPQKFEDFVTQIEELPSVIYLDPMFPEKKKKASVKKEMQYFQLLLQEEDKAAEMLALARKYAKDKVVVKRPVYAPQVAEDIARVVESKSLRFEIYKPLS